MASTSPFSVRTRLAGPGLVWPLPLVTLVLSLGLTGLAYRVAAAGATRNDEARLERLSDRVVSQLRSRVDSANEALYAARAHLLTTERVTGTSWAEYAASALPAVGEGLVGLGYIERIRREDVPRLEARVRQEGVRSFRVEQGGTREWVYAVTRIAPALDNAGVLGLDIASGNTRRVAADEAMWSGRPVLSRRIRIREGTTEVPGFLFFLPVYRDRQDLDTPEARTEALVGWVYTSLRIDALTTGLLESVEHQIDFSLAEDSAQGPSPVLFSTGPSSTDEAPAERAVLNVFGRSWTADFRLRPADGTLWRPHPAASHPRLRRARLRS